MDRKLTLYQKIVARWNNYILVGVIGFIIGSVMCAINVSVVDMYYEHQLKTSTAKLEGYVVNVWEAGWDEYDDPTLFAYAYYFIHPELGEIKNTSFAKHKMARYKVEQKVNIVYLVTNPYANKINGMYYMPNSSNALFSLLILVVGIITGAYGLWVSRKDVPLLFNGVFVWGKFLRNRKVLTKDGEKRAYELYYEYEASDGLFYTLSTITTEPKNFENDEIVVCNPNNHNENRLLYDYPHYLAKFIEKNWEDVKKMS